MDLEDQIAKIIKDEYVGWEDEGRSTAAAHDIMNLLLRVDAVGALVRIALHDPSKLRSFGEARDVLHTIVQYADDCVQHASSR